MRIEINITDNVSAREEVLLARKHMECAYVAISSDLPLPQTFRGRDYRVCVERGADGAYVTKDQK